MDNEELRTSVIFYKAGSLANMCCRLLQIKHR